MFLTSFFQKIKSRDAILIFSFLWDRLARRSGTVAGTTYERIASELNAAGLSTSRGALFSRAVVTARIKELKEAGVVDLIDAGTSGAFDLLVYNPAPNPTPLFPTDDDRTPSLFRFQNENKNENESQNETSAPVALAKSGEIPTLPTFGNGETEDGGDENANAPSKEINININKKINKRAKDFFENLESDEVGRPIERLTGASKPGLRGSADGSRAVAEAAPSVADVRLELDFESPRVVSLRRLVVRDIWEPELRADLVDRAVFAIARGIVKRGEWAGIVAEAQNERRLFSKTERGRRTLWETICLRVKSAFDSAGWEWSPTNPRREPEPERPRPVALDDDGDETPPIRNAAPRRAAERPNKLAELERDAEGFDVDDLKLSFADLTRKVADVRGLDGMTAQTTAIFIRGALKRLSDFRDAAKMVGAAG